MSVADRQHRIREADETVSDFIKAIEKKSDNGSFRLWKTQLNEWYLVFRAKGIDHDFAAPSLVAVLEIAANYVPLPSYPRKLQPLAEHHFSISREGKEWMVYCGVHFYCGLGSKKSAELSIKKWVAEREDARQRWDDKYGPLIAGKTEGVDFRWIN